MDASVVREEDEEQKRFIVFELLCEQLGLHVFKLAAVNSQCAAWAKQRSSEFLNRLVALSNRMGQLSFERSEAFWNSPPIDIYENYLSYHDRTYWLHPNNGGIGSLSRERPWTMTRDQTFSARRTKECFVRAAMVGKRPVHRPDGFWRPSHALCEPLFFRGPINFYKRMAVPNTVLYNAVVLGVTPPYPGQRMDRNQRFLLKRVVEAGQEIQGCGAGNKATA